MNDYELSRSTNRQYVPRVSSFAGSNQLLEPVVWTIPRTCRLNDIFIAWADADVDQLRGEANCPMRPPIRCIYQTCLGLPRLLKLGRKKFCSCFIPPFYEWEKHGVGPVVCSSPLGGAVCWVKLTAHQAITWLYIRPWLSLPGELLKFGRKKFCSCFISVFYYD